MALDFLVAANSTGQSRGLEFTDEDDLDLCLYYLRTLSNVFRWAPDALWDVLATRNLQAEGRESTLSALSK